MPDATYTLELLDRVPRATIVHHVDEQGGLYASYGRTAVYIGADGRRERLGRFPREMPRDLFGLTRLSQRAARADKCNLYLNSAGNLLGIRGCKVYAVGGGETRPLFEILGDSVLHGGLCEDDAGWTYFGEYYMNPERGPVRIWRVSPGLDAWEVAHEFAPGRTRHVHGVYRDPHAPGTLWATLGDFEDECYFVRTTDRFETVELIGAGTQAWRCVRPMFTPTHVGWITDSHLEPNRACRFDRETQTLEVGQSFPCSGWYGFQADGLYVASTTVERGPAITSDQAGVYVSEDAFHWSLAGSFKKDLFRPMRVFKYGVVAYPSGRVSADAFVVSGEGLVGLDGRSRRCRLRRNGGDA